MASGAIAIAYETVTDPQGHLPLLTPMSEVAGRMATQVGAQYLERPHGGRGILLGGVPGVAPADVLVIGAGAVGGNAALIAAGMGAIVTVVAPDPKFLRPIAEQLRRPACARWFPPPTPSRRMCKRADLVIGAALVPGAVAPKLISAATVKAMKPGSVIVDVAIDQGGNAETSHPTTHSDADLRGGWRGALLRRQHAGRRATHLDLRSQQRHPAVRSGARQQGLATGSP